ncbi:MAG: hypothetical protein ACUVRK_09040 [Spirochaetota bacterium]
MKQLLFVLFILSFWVHASANIHGTAMGGIATVTSEGAVDTTRNPALLGTVSAKTASFYLTGNAYYSQDKNPDFTAPGLSIYSINQKNNYYYSLSLFAGYAKPSAHGTIGYSLSSKENLYLKREDTQKIKGSLPPYFEQTETTVTEEINPTLSIAYGWKLSDNHYTGIQLAVTPFLSTVTTDNENTLSNTYSYTKDEYGVIIQPSLGFLLTSNVSQVGLRLIPSTIKCVKKKVEAGFSTTDLSYSDSWDIQQYEGPQIVVGGYAKILPQTGIAIESGLFLPSAYTNTDINVTDNPVPAINHSSANIYNDPIVTIKGGIQYFLTEKLDCMAGAAFSHFISSAGSSKSYGRGKYNLLLLTFGSNYSVSPTVLLSMIVMVTNGCFESYYHEKNTSSIDAKVKSQVWYVTVGTGLSYRL